MIKYTHSITLFIALISLIFTTAGWSSFYEDEYYDADDEREIILLQTLKPKDQNIPIAKEQSKDSDKDIHLTPTQTRPAKPLGSDPVLCITCFDF